MKIRFKCITILILFFCTFFSSVSFASEDLNIDSGACILVDMNYGQILYEKNSSDKLYPASTTKLMTAILVSEKCNLNDNVTISYWAVNSVPSGYSSGKISPGKSYTVEELLNITMIASANDAAFALAEHIANLDNPNYLKNSSSDAKKSFEESINKFSEMMNQKAKEIGCLNSNFVNPNGIHNENHYSTAYDLALIGAYAYSNMHIRLICSKTTYTLSKNSVEYKSTNQLLVRDSNYYYEYANGLKTGYTDPAGHCIIATASKDDRNLLVVILNGYTLEDDTATRETDCINLFNYGFDCFSPTELIHEGDVIRKINIFNGTMSTKSLDLICTDSLHCLIPKGKVVDVTPNIELINTIAPIANKQIVGTITYNIDGIKYSSNLIATHDVYSSNVTHILIVLFGIFIILLIPVIVLSIKDRY